MDTVPLLTATNLHKTYRRHAIECAGAAWSLSGGAGARVPQRHRRFRLRQEHAAASARHPRSTRQGAKSTWPAAPHRRSAVEGARDRLRNQTFGFIFQFYHLLPELTALENVVLPQMIAHSVFWLAPAMRRRGAAAAGGRTAGSCVGLGHRLHHKPPPRTVRGRDAGGQPSPAPWSIGPHVLLADEPTGNLDVEATGSEIIKLLRDLNRQAGLTIIMVTHNHEIVAATDRVVRLAGRACRAAERARSRSCGQPSPTPWTRSRS